MTPPTLCQGTRYFLYDGGMPVLELDANKKITTSYLYGADGVVYRRQHNAVAHWHFDEGNGAIAHDVDGTNHGTLGRGEADRTPTWSFGCGLLFDGVDDLVKVPDSDALDLAGDKMTIAAWVKPHSAQAGPLVRKMNNDHGYRLNLTGTRAIRFVLRRYSRTKIVTSTTTLPLNQWTHVAARYDGAQMRIFINGTLDTATTAATSANTPRATTAPVLIGAHTNNYHFHGYLDDISIYNRALSDSEITDLMNDVDKRYEYHHINALGSNIVSTDDNQNVLVRYEYDVFGAIRSEIGTSDNTRKFTGKEFDADSNLYYYGARYYDPYIGRFTQRDPIGDGVNWYAYTRNNPLKFVDPTGMVIKLVDGNHSVSITSASDIPTQITGALGQSSNLDWLINIFAKSGDGAALSQGGILNDTLKTVIESSIVTTVQFVDELQAAALDADAVAETIPTTIGDAIDSITINILSSIVTGQPYTALDTRLPSLRTASVHELSHASNMINEPALANTNYVNRLTLEFRAYDLGAQWWESLTVPNSGAYSPPIEIVNAVENYGIKSYGYYSTIFNRAKSAAEALP